MSKKCISTDKAPKAIGPYSQGIVIDWKKLVFCSGQLAIDPAIGKLIEGDVAKQTERVIENLNAVLTAAGSGLENVVKTTVFLKNMDDFKAMNEVYMRYFKSDFPARSAFQVAKLPLDGLVEIEAIAFIA